MPTVVVSRGYAIKVLTRDHAPPHVHVYKDGVVLKILLEPIVFTKAKHGRPTEHTKREAIALVKEHIGACWIVWRRIYGEDPQT